jgi:hypothetical protein
MKATWLASVVIAAIMATPALAEDLLLFGGDGHKEFLGCLNCSELEPTSVWNEISTYGWKNGFGTWNPFGSYKNPFGSHSACNELAASTVCSETVDPCFGRTAYRKLKQERLTMARIGILCCFVHTLPSRRYNQSVEVWAGEHRT